MLKIRDGIDLKELEKYGWELDSEIAPSYYKNISNILHYTFIYVDTTRKYILGCFDDYSTIYDYDDEYKYVEIACGDLIKDGLVEKVED